MSSSPVGLLDTNVVVHALVNDDHTTECRTFLAAIRDGTVRVVVDALVVHELTYVLTRRGPRLDALEAARFIMTILTMRGVEGSQTLLIEAVMLWGHNPERGFVDCYLATKAQTSQMPVYTKNVRHLRSLGAVVPDPLPGS